MALDMRRTFDPAQLNYQPIAVEERAPPKKYPQGYVLSLVLCPFIRNSRTFHFAVIVSRWFKRYSYAVLWSRLSRDLLRR